MSLRAVCWRPCALFLASGSPSDGLAKSLLDDAVERATGETGSTGTGDR